MDSENHQECILDHVAVAVKDLDRAQKVYEDLGLIFSKEREVVESEGVTTAFAQMDTHARLELLAPYGESGPLHDFLAKRGPGLHHVSFSVPDVVAKCNELAAKGYKLLRSEPTIGAGGKLVNFIHPKSTGGVLIEISGPAEKQ